MDTWPTTTAAAALIITQREEGSLFTFHKSVNSPSPTGCIEDFFSSFTFVYLANAKASNRLPSNGNLIFD